VRAAVGWRLALLLLAAPLAAQDTSLVARARAAYDTLDYAGAIAAARQALQGPLRESDRVTAYEVLGYSYGALDSTRAAVEAFKALIFLAPDLEPDVERVSPRITSLYASALGQVLVVRHVALDSSTFVAGQGTARLHYYVSRAALTTTRVVGAGVDLAVDTQTVNGATQVPWPVQGRDGTPLPPGDYDLVVTAREGERSEYASAPLRIRVEHGRVDTMPLLTSLPGYERQPEMVSPPRDWRPVALAVLYAGIGSAAVLAVDGGKLGTGPRTALISVSGGAALAGLALSLRRPDPRPSPTNILYNRLLGELLERRNAEIGRENENRRLQVLVTVGPVHP
jgi:hypothetical protein